MNEKISNKLRMEVLKGLSTVRNIKEDSQGFFDNLVNQGIDMIVQNAVPNEELHYNKSCAEVNDAKAVQDKAAPETDTATAEPDELMQKLCSCSDQDFERLKNMLAEAERKRGQAKE